MGIYHCVFFIYNGKCHFLKGASVMWICEFEKFGFFVVFFFSPSSRVEEWKFGKMAEMIRMWGNQNEWCVEFANVFVIGINNGSKYFSERIFFKSVMMDYESMLQAQSSSAFT